MSKLSADRLAIADDLLNEANEAPSRYSDVELYANQLAEISAELENKLEKHINLAHGGQTCIETDAALEELRERRTEAISDLRGATEAVREHEQSLDTALDEWDD